MTLQKYFSHPSLFIHFFSTQLMKLKLGQQIGGGLLIANHLDQWVWWANQKHWATVRSYLLHSFLEVNNVAAQFTSQRKLSNYLERKPLSEAKPACSDFSSSNFTVHDHIVSTSGDALTHMCRFTVGRGCICPFWHPVLPSSWGARKSSLLLQ